MLLWPITIQHSACHAEKKYEKEPRCNLLHSPQRNDSVRQVGSLMFPSHFWLKHFNVLVSLKVNCTGIVSNWQS